MQKFKELKGEEVQKAILAERNQSLKELNNDIHEINNIMTNLSLMLGKDSDNINQVVNHVEKTRDNVETGTSDIIVAEKEYKTNKELMRDGIIMGGGILFGSLGFVAGPIVGALTISTSSILAAGVITFIRTF